MNFKVCPVRDQKEKPLTGFGAPNSIFEIQVWSLESVVLSLRSVVLK